jgi:CheY-like chemotaxis protein
MPETALKRVGVLGTEGDNPITSHIYAQWAPLMNPPAGFARRTGLTITHVWDKDRGEAEKFARLFNVPHVVDKYDGMVGQVDAVIQSGYKGSFWASELVRPYMDAGIPVYIDRPGAYSVARIRDLTARAAKHDCPLMITNNHENTRAVELLQMRARRLSPLTGLIADSLTDRQMLYFSMHCIHGWYMLYPLLAGMVKATRTYLASDDFASPVTLFECENPDGSPFTAILQRHRVVHRGYVKLFGKSASLEGTLYEPADYSLEQALNREQLVRDTQQAKDYLLTDFSLPVIRKLEVMIETRKMPQTYEQINEKVQVFLASFRSLLEDGRRVEVASLDPSWTAPNPYPDYFPENFFPKA